MLVTSLKLKNIRSYLEESITFLEGSTLLIGDIGCGKSTILLAIEFALFGTRRTELDASSLLRNGTQQGSVTLTFKLDGKIITIQRNLKRGKSSISQESGYVEINGVREEGTAVELKSKMLSILGYPDELVTKSKSLIYRYTVFTPQEAMKHILFDNVEERLNTLRKLFNMDRYKRVKENTQIILREMRATKRACAMMIEDLEKLQDEFKVLEAQQLKNQKQLQENHPVWESLDKKLKEKLNLQQKLETELQKNESVKREIKITEEKQKFMQETITRNHKSKLQLEQEINQLRLIKKPQLPENPGTYEETLDNAISLLEQKNEAYLKTLSTTEYAIEQAQMLVNKIDTLEKCPTCLQAVGAEHKHEIGQQQKTIIQEKESLLLQNKSEFTLNKEKLGRIKQNKQTFQKILLSDKEYQITQKRIEEKQQQSLQCDKETTDAKKRIGELESAVGELRKQVKEEHSQKILELKKNIEQLREQHRKQELLINDFKKEIKLKGQIIDQTKQAIDKKLLIKKQLAKQVLYQQWLEDYFIKVVDLIEKQVFVTIHREFDETFRTWFSSVIDDETIDVRLDESFAPLVEQNGYEQFVENLSGGEKTSVALAYRLALNKAVNSFVGTIKTKDIIILDEPTDGFSSEQLDRMREVLEKLNMKQTIIVSHEPKMETYVQNVMRVVKRDHVSRVS